MDTLPVIPADLEPPMDADELQALVRAEAEDAIDFIEKWIEPQRAAALKSYRGDLYGNEEEGRSKVVSRDVRDAVQSYLPSLVRVFCSSDRAVEYMPQGPEDVEGAEQATDYVDRLIMEENDGVALFYTVFKDSLIAKAGIIKYFVDESVEVRYHDFTGLDEAGVGLVMSEPGTELVSMGQGELGLDIRVKRVRRSPRIKLAAVPPEEFLIDRRAKSIDAARYVAHRQYLPVADLVALGYDRDTVEGNVTTHDRFSDSQSNYERLLAQGGYHPTDTKNAQERPVLYVEHYVRADWDGDGIAELLRVCTMGDGYEVVHVEPCWERPFAAFCPDPEPHTFWGSDIADLTVDLQKIATNIKRAILDSLSLHLYPRTGYVEGRVDYEDIVNTEMGAPIAMDAPGMVQPFTIPFVGTAGLAVLDSLIEQEKDRRVGTHNVALDADALQSTTKAAVDAQVDAGRQRLEMVARLYAEGPMKRLYRGLLRLVRAHRNQREMVRLRGQWVEVDPSAWNANMDVTVRTGLGRGMAEDRIRALGFIQQFQREVLSQMGPNNPMVGLGHASNAFAKAVESMGFKDSTQFANKLPLDFQVPQPPPKPDPAELLAEVERLKILADMGNEAAKLELDREEYVTDTYFRAMEADISADKAKAEIERMGRD